MGYHFWGWNQINLPPFYLCQLWWRHDMATLSTYLVLPYFHEWMTKLLCGLFWSVCNGNPRLCAYMSVHILYSKCREILKVMLNVQSTNVYSNKNSKTFLYMMSNFVVGTASADGLAATTSARAIRFKYIYVTTSIILTLLLFQCIFFNVFLLWRSVLTINFVSIRRNFRYLPSSSKRETSKLGMVSPL